MELMIEQVIPAQAGIQIFKASRLDESVVIPAQAGIQI